MRRPVAMKKVRNAVMELRIELKELRREGEIESFNVGSFLSDIIKKETGIDYSPVMITESLNGNVKLKKEVLPIIFRELKLDYELYKEFF